MSTPKQVKPAVEPRRSALTVVKRLLVGRSQPTWHMEHSTLPKVLALPILSSDPLSSVAYATEQIMVVLLAAGAGSLHLVMPIALSIAALLGVAVPGARRGAGPVRHAALPSGGTDPRPCGPGPRRRAARAVRDPARVLIGSDRPDRGGGHLERGSPVQPAPGPQRPADPAVHGGRRHRHVPGGVVPGHPGPRHGQRAAVRGGPDRPRRVPRRRG